jgi:hypothetical protein
MTFHGVKIIRCEGLVMNFNMMEPKIQLMGVPEPGSASSSPDKTECITGIIIYVQRDELHQQNSNTVKLKWLPHLHHQHSLLTPELCLFGQKSDLKAYIQLVWRSLYLFRFMDMETPLVWSLTKHSLCM